MPFTDTEADDQLCTQHNQWNEISATLMIND